MSNSLIILLLGNKSPKADDPRVIENVDTRKFFYMSSNAHISVEKGGIYYDFVK